ncbi:hypothetical protein B0G69_7869 [Paraburkholderia sp. RAU2J]|nr:hypothetical protein B0G69_7869 [Paraburkholderia sp. RAU2J]
MFHKGDNPDCLIYLEDALPPPRAKTRELTLSRKLRKRQRRNPREMQWPMPIAS